MKTSTRVALYSLSAAPVLAALDAGPPATARAQEAGPPPTENFSRPLPGLTSEERARFEAGRTEFESEEGVADGVGPIFNDGTDDTATVSCAGCHSEGGTGGGSDFLERRFGRRDGEAFDPLEELGGTLLQFSAIPGYHAGGVPAEADVQSLRRSQPLFGLGLVDAVPDEAFHELARQQQERHPATAGRVSIATNRANQQPAISRFGWKAQVQSLLEFSANAYVNEMGITTPMFPLENCPEAPPGTCEDEVPDPDDDGADVLLFRDFMLFLAPPPRGPITAEVERGDALFGRIGCADCHTPTLETGAHEIAALDRKELHPYSDFLLHDMGTLGDGIGGSQADASGIEAIAMGKEMRTQPLWGLRILDMFMHDGRATTLPDAIAAHDGQGANARKEFFNLAPEEQAAVIEFLKSL